jgi:hypothetical protein
MFHWRALVNAILDLFEKVSGQRPRKLQEIYAENNAFVTS